MSSADEVTRLRDCLDTLVSITALPALWTGSEPAHIVSTLLDTLLVTLRLTFVFVRLNDPAGGPPMEMERFAESSDGTVGADCSLASARVGVQGEIGTVVAGSLRLDFPAETDRLVLDVAANQATIALQQAHAVAERRRAQEALQEREQESRAIVHTIPGLVAILTPAGDVDVVNHELVEYCGQPLEAMRQWGTNGTVHAEDLPGIIPVFTQAIASGEPYDFDARIRRFDGAYRWCQVRGLPLRDSGSRIVRWYVLLTDIEERKRAEEVLRANELNFQVTVDSIPGMVHTMTATGALEFVNQQVLDFFGKPLEELNRWDMLVHPDDRARVVEGWTRSVTRGEPFDAELRALRADGTYRWIHSRGLPLRDVNGNIVRWYNLLTDIDDLKRAEAARAELAHVSRATTLSALTASIAHEVNQPLSGIITNAGTCLRMLDADPPNLAGARETARRTIRDGNRAADVIARLRALFGKRAFTLEPLDLNEAAREVIALSSNDLQRNRIILQPELAADLPTITGDRIQLQQVILNLLRNASDAMAEVHDRPRQLLLRTARDDGDRVRLTVRDAGSGLPESLDSLFDAFYTTKSGGMGIGLFVSRSIVERHHGRLWAEPNDGPGATFSLSIPCDPARVTDAIPVVRPS